jgi:hypothetical protein
VTTRYAAETKVPVERSQNELVTLLKKHGATAHAFGVENGVARVMFQLGGRRVRFELSVPNPDDFVSKIPWNLAYNRRKDWCDRQAEQAERQRWRALLLVCKAKLELIAEGMGTVETEFMANIVLPNNQLVGEWLAPQIESAYANKKMPPLLPGASK